MRLRVKKIKFLAGSPVCMIQEKTAKKLSLHVGDRIRIKRDGKSIISVVDFSDIVNRGEIALSRTIFRSLNLKPNDHVRIEIAEDSPSIEIIKKKLKGKTLNKKEIYEIIQNIANNSLTSVEVAFFVSAIYTEGMNMTETRNLIKAMVDTGNKIKLRGKIFDKHSIGGVAGNRTTPIIVSICAAAGLTIPKTSSRAITSAAGTADVMETVVKVDFSVKEIKKIIRKANACFVWGGALGLAPVDDKIIRVERIVNVDSTAQLLASILSKKLSVGSKYVVIDIPCGKSAKVSCRRAEKLKNKFQYLGKKFDLKLKIVLTDGSQPIGNGVGPMLEIIDVIKVLERDNPPKDLEKKSVILAGCMLELAGKAKKGKGEKMAQEILDSGKAFKKFKQIVKVQRGSLKRVKFNPKLSYDLKASKNGKVRHISNKLVNQVARAAGSPDDKSAGVYLYKKEGNIVKRGDKILTIYTESEDELKHAKRFTKKNKIVELV
jgi:AMP phosphorylase